MNKFKIFTIFKEFTPNLYYIALGLTIFCICLVVFRLIKKIKFFPVIRLFLYAVILTILLTGNTRMMVLNDNNINNNQAKKAILLSNKSKDGNSKSAYKSNQKIKASTSSNTIKLHDLDGRRRNYSFKYKNETYKATYSTDNWKITNSYKITDKKDMAMICQALIDEHPIHGKDMSSYRTVEDMVYEWDQHNIAYTILPEDSPWKKHAKDVDFNPSDQGKSMQDMYEARAGKNSTYKKSKRTLKKYMKIIKNNL